MTFQKSVPVLITTHRSQCEHVKEETIPIKLLGGNSKDYPVLPRLFLGHHHEVDIRVNEGNVLRTT